MDNTAWLAPPGAAQPAGIQSTAGAVPVVNEKGEVSMKKVKVQRYVSGKRPEYAPASSDEEESDAEDFTQPRAPNQSDRYPPHKSLTEAELQDPRLKRLLAIREAEATSHFKPIQVTKEDYEDEPHRVVHQAEVVEISDVEDEDDNERAVPDAEKFSKAHLFAASDEESEGEVEEDELALRRLRMRERAMQKVTEEEEVMRKEDEGSEESSEEESSEYTEESDSEEEGPRLKPVFVRRKDRVTIHQKETQQVKQKQQMVEGKKRAEERRRDTLRMIEHEHRQQTAVMPTDGTLNNIQDINTDDEADDAEYEAWKLRELKRLKRDKEEREQMEKEKEEIDRMRNMTEEERRLELRNNPKVVTNKATKGKYKFLQKYYHRGAFFLDNEDDVYRRDFSGATLDDHFDKTILPKVMQVKNFGRSGRTKYTHLVDQDTTAFDSPWAAETQMNHKFANAAAGGLKQVVPKASNKRSQTNAPTTRK